MTTETKKRRLFSYISVDLLERTRTAVFWTPGASLTGMIEAALTAYIDKLEKKNGKPFSKRRGELLRGRRIG